MSLVTTFCSRRAASRPDDAHERELVARADARRRHGRRRDARGRGRWHSRPQRNADARSGYRTGMGLFRSTAERKASALGIDAARLPPGQYATAKWPVLQAGVDPAPRRPRDLDVPHLRRGREAARALVGRVPRAAVGRDPHRHPLRHALVALRHDVPRACSFREIVRLTRPLPEVEHVISHGEQGYTANLPLGVMDDDDVDAGLRGRRRAARARARLPAAPGRPEALLLEVDQVAARPRVLARRTSPGFWERYGYHNDADPFLEQRTVF